jgi:hypothetical protein
MEGVLAIFHKLKKIVIITQNANRHPWQFLEKISMHFIGIVR